MKSGHRLVLRHELTYTKPCEVDSAIGIKNKINKPLRLILSSWRRQRESVNHLSLGYVFENEYENVDLCHRNLKGRDHYIVTRLQEVCKETGFYIYLANLTKSIEGAKYDTPSGSLTLDQVVDLDGSPPFDLSDLPPFEESDIIQDDPFEEPSEDSYYDSHCAYEVNQSVSSLNHLRFTVC